MIAILAGRTAGTLLALAVLVFGLVATGIARAADPARWTIFVYMAADNDLARFAVDDLIEMQNGLPAEGVEVIAFVDLGKTRLGWTGARMLRVRPSADKTNVAAEVIAEIGPVHSGDPTLLSRSMTEAFKRFPAEKHGVVLWNHGGGWSAMLMDFDIPGRQGDRQGMSMVQASDAIRKGLAAAGLPRLDLLGLDMCLMGQLETVAETHDIARVLVASQAIEPGTGWAYDRFLRAFARPDVPTRDIATAIVDGFSSFNQEKGEQVSTLSAVDLDKAVPLLQRFDSVLKILEPQVPQAWGLTSQSLFWAETFAVQGRVDDLSSGSSALASVDIVDSFSRMEANLKDRGGIGGELAAFRTAVQDAIIANKAINQTQRAKGLSIYAPLREDNLSKAYAETRLAKETRWLAFLQQIHRQQASAPPPEVTSLGVFNVLTNQTVNKGAFGDPLVFRAEMKGENILFATGQVSRRDARLDRTLILSVSFLLDTELARERLKDARDFADLLVPQYTPAGSKLTLDASGLTFLIASGDQFVEATLDSTTLGEKAVPRATARAVIERTGVGRADAIVQFNPSTLTADLVVVLLDDDNGRKVQRTMDPEPGDLFTFMVMAQKPDGSREWLPAGPPMPWGKTPPKLVVDLARPGDYYLSVRPEGIAGPGTPRHYPVSISYPNDAVLTLLNTGRSLRPAALVGDWADASGTPWLRLGPPNAEGLLPAKILTAPMDEELAKRGYTLFAQLETRRMPILSIVARDAKGRLEMIEGAIVMARPGDQNRLIMRTFLGQKGDARGQLAEMVRVGVNSAPPAVDPAPGPTTQPGPVPPQGNEAAALSGVWQGTSQDGSQIALSLLPNGRFEEYRRWPNGFTLATAGQWAARGRVVSYQVQQANPPSVCNAQGQCQAVDRSVQQIPFELRDNGRVLATATSLLQRVR